ncbi:hypothetical protein MKK84_05370 [Methylobacterium sp. E-065]|uniref:hypothetical protein n=1 Tax=Methylobacterium sp. E-065 TaxID=2836583 RepID=UPI001FBA0670|nr:hypothetical protein [Methylobacterium sp. E-065]MCJ2016862.1 hypothetical protein [Methylobacterium sp. E-065]
MASSARLAPLGAFYDDPDTVPPGFTGYVAPVAPTGAPVPVYHGEGLTALADLALGAGYGLADMGQRTADLYGRIRSGEIAPGAFSRAVASHALGGLYDTAASAVTAPRDAYSGALPVFGLDGHVTDEAMGRANQMAGFAMTGSMPFKAPAGAIRSFGGGESLDDILASMSAAMDKGTASAVQDIRPISRVDPRAVSWDLYHGTDAPADFTRFDTNLPKAQRGHTPSSETGGVFLSPSADEAAQYSGSIGGRAGAEAGPRVIRATVDPGRTDVFDLPHLMENDPAFVARARQTVIDENDGRPAAGRMFDERHARMLEEFQSARDLNKQLTELGYPATEVPQVQWGYGATGAAMQMARERGLDTAVLRGLSESNGGDQIVALTPGRVRSYYDPEHLLYSGGPAGAVAGVPVLASSSGPKGATMENPFDQFDAAPVASTAASNPFDQFDAPAPQPRAASFADRFGDGPMASTLDTSTPEGLALRRTADERLVGPPSVTNAAAVAAMRAGNAFGLNLPRNAGAAIASLPGVGNGRGFSENYTLAKDQEDALARQYPKTAIAGTGAGIGAGAVGLPAIRAAEGAGFVARALANFGTGLGYGAASEFADSKDLGSAAKAGLVGGGVGVLGGGLLDAGGKVYSAFARRGAPFRTADGGLTDQATAALREAGIDPATITPEIEAAFAAKGPSAAAAREAQAAEFGLPLSRGQATADPQILAQEGRALAGQSGSRAQEIGQDFTARQTEALTGVRDRFQGMAAGTFDRIERPQEAYEAVADRARQAVQADAERASVAQRGLDDALRAVRGRGGADALDGATAAAQGLREASAQGKAGYRAAYDDVGALPHVFDAGALDMLGSRVRSRLAPDVVIDDRLTPAAHRALQDLDQVPEIFNLAPGQGPSLAQTEQLRRRVGSLYPSTATNPADRRALGAVLDEYDSHLNDAAAIGALNRPSAAPAAAVDDFPGFAAPSAAPAPTSAAGGAPTGTGEPETLMRFLGRSGGVPLDAEARAADLHRAYVPGQGTLARNNAPTWDQIRVRLAEEGFLPPGMDGTASARDVADWARNAIQTERTGGRPVVRMGEESGIGGRRAADSLAGENAAYTERMAPFHQQVADDLAAAGVDPRQAHPEHLEDAAARLYRGEHDNGADAFEAAIMGRPAGETPRGPAPEIPFDGATARATSDALPIGDTAPLEAMQRARGLFRQYQTTFKPRGPGDTAGANLRRIVERDASPNEVASMLFGSTTGRVSPGQMQTLARLRDAVGTDSEPWAAVQRGLIARHLGGEGQDLGRRLDYLLRGEGRTLTAYLSEEQRAGLGQLRAAVQQAENAGRPTPTWATDLERTGFDPNAVGRSLFGSSGAIGAKPGAAAEARAARAFLGADSQEWSGLRQAAAQRLIDPATPATKMVGQLRDFTDGAGKGVASTLFSAEELGHFRRLAAALQATVRPDGTIKPGAAGEVGRKAVAKAADLIAGAIAFKVGGLGAAAGTYGAKVGTRAIIGGLGAASARRSFEGGAPRLLAPPPTLPAGQVGAGAGLYAGQQ